MRPSYACYRFVWHDILRGSVDTRHIAPRTPYSPYTTLAVYVVIGAGMDAVGELLGNTSFPRTASDAVESADSVVAVKILRRLP